MQVEPEGDFVVELDCVLDKMEILLQNRTIGQVKVQWKHPDPKEETWELESHIRIAYPTLFHGSSKNGE